MQVLLNPTEHFVSLLHWKPEESWVGEYLGAWLESDGTIACEMVSREHPQNRWDSMSDAGMYPPVTHVATVRILPLSALSRW